MWHGQGVCVASPPPLTRQRPPTLRFASSKGPIDPPAIDGASKPIKNLHDDPDRSAQKQGDLQAQPGN